MWTGCLGSLQVFLSFSENFLNLFLSFMKFYHVKNPTVLSMLYGTLTLSSEHICFVLAGVVIQFLD